MFKWQVMEPDFKVDIFGHSWLTHVLRNKVFFCKIYCNFDLVLVEYLMFLEDLL